MIDEPTEICPYWTRDAPSESTGCRNGLAKESTTTCQMRSSPKQENIITKLSSPVSAFQFLQVKKQFDKCLVGKEEKIKHRIS